jgi:flagellar biogenesis protein FliO
MDFLRSPRNKLIAAAVLIAVLAAAAQAHGFDAVSLSRWLIAGLSMVGLGFWALKKRNAAPAFALPPRLRVLSKTGLSQRCSLALVEADGRNFLVAFGDGFAEMREAPHAAPRTRKTSSRKGGVR